MGGGRPLELILYRILLGFIVAPVVVQFSRCLSLSLEGKGKGSSKYFLLWGMVVYARNLSIWEAEAGGHPQL